MRAYHLVEPIEKKTIFDIVHSFFSSLSTTISLDIVVPKNVYLRAKLLCEYIEEQIEIDFDVYDFILLLYLDFVKKSVEKYEPLKIYRALNKSKDNDYLIIKDGDKTYKYPKNQTTKAQISLTIKKSFASKGHLLLEEIHDLYGHEISFENMLASLLINFIEDYKRGDNNKAFKQIIHMIKNHKKELI